MNAKSVSALGAALITFATGTAAYAAAGAATTNKVFISGPLILIFLGFCALVVVAQVIPVIVELYGLIKGAVTRKEKAPADVKAN